MLKVNACFSQKVGQPDFGSRGASVSLEVELESGLVNQPDHLQEHIRHLFRLARDAVEQEPDFRAAPDGRDTVPGDGQQDGGHRGRRGRRATRSQILAIHGIATRQGIDLDGLLRDRYRVCQLYELSVSEASRLIDELKASTNKAEGQR